MKAQALRRLLKESFVYMPPAYDALGGRLVEDLGFKAVYIGGFHRWLTLHVGAAPYNGRAGARRR